jgi:hypothetical protein
VVRVAFSKKLENHASAVALHYIHLELRADSQDVALALYRSLVASPAPDKLFFRVAGDDLLRLAGQ